LDDGADMPDGIAAIMLSKFFAINDSVGGIGQRVGVVHGPDAHINHVITHSFLANYSASTRLGLLVGMSCKTHQKYIPEHE
jgi:hypothetical protein